MNYRRTRLSLFSYGILTFLLLGYLLHVHVPFRPNYSWPPAEFSYDHELEEPLDQDQSCQFPNLNPFDPSVLPHIFDAEPIRCKQGYHPLTWLDGTAGRLLFNLSGLREAGYQHAGHLDCHYRPLLRVDDDNVRYGPPTPLPPEGVLLPPSDEFVAVDCTNFVGATVYSNLHARIFAKRNRTRHADGTGLNVIFLVVDSMSRSNFIRQLPRTYAYLTRDMGATVLRGITTVGDNTFPNLVPILSGQQTLAYPELIQQNELAGSQVFQSRGPYDEAPLLFRHLSRTGYATLLAEDLPVYAIFNYFADGFLRPPVDHYLRPFWLALESHPLHRFMSSNLCFGRRPKHLLQLDYLEDFARTYYAARVPFFGFAVFTEIGHDFMNQAGAADADFAAFLSRLHRGGMLDDTMLVMMGDHGNRMSSILETPVGRLEKRLPMAALALPPRLKRSPHYRQMASQLRQNGKRLTTVFDLYRTALQVTDADFERNWTVADGLSSSSVARGKTASHFGSSLLGPISASRTCPEAGIPFQYCACDKETSVSTDEARVRLAALAIVQSVNNYTRPHRRLCAVVSLKTITGAVVLLPHDIDLRRGKGDQPLPRANEFLSGGAGQFKLRVTVLVSPSDALFEAMVVLYGGEQESVFVAPGVGRMNAYGGQSDCVNWRHAKPETATDAEDSLLLKAYCYCKSNLPAST